MNTSVKSPSWTEKVDDMIESCPTEKLKTLDFALSIFPYVGSQNRPKEQIRKIHTMLDADYLIFKIQLELDKAKTIDEESNKLSYSRSDFYRAVGLPKEFLKK